MFYSLNVDYKAHKTELCDIGAKYDTDKSPERKNPSFDRHVHPYTIVYQHMFEPFRLKELDFVEIGILHGASLNMWNEYLPNTRIYGYDFNQEFLNNVKKDKNIKVALMNVKDAQSIRDGLKIHDKQYDCIIEDSTHEFDDQVRVIKESLSFVKPGGMIIIEDIYKRIPEQRYREALSDICDEFQDIYFITLDHKNRMSEGHDNDKLLILVKGGAPPIFNQPKENIIVITPCSRPNNIKELEKSIPFEIVSKWIIVYDGKHISNDTKQYTDNEKIEEYYVYIENGISGNPQRNFALDLLHKRLGTGSGQFVYFLDDDNVVYRDFKNISRILDDKKFYTFNQSNGLRGNTVQVDKIDTGMYLVPLDYYCNKPYRENLICSCPQEDWVYVNNDICTYNILKETIVPRAANGNIL
jgi:SAM-dependent methyltransferase